MVPQYDMLDRNYPSHIGLETLKRMIGGHVNRPEITDTCAIRMSRALNYAGIRIPHGDYRLLTVSGSDRLWYAIRMQELKRWLYQRLGIPNVIAVRPRITKAQFIGIKGIIAFDIVFGLNTDGRTRALGHIDLWDGSSYTHQAEDLTDYFSGATQIVLWKAP